jgi:hypothetical protein
MILRGLLSLQVLFNRRHRGHKRPPLFRIRAQSQSHSPEIIYLPSDTDI